MYIFHRYNNYGHITHRDNVDSIIENGIRCNEDGDIFIYRDCDVEHNFMPNKKPVMIPIYDLIAMGQVFLKDFAIFNIEPEGFEVELIPDNVAEITASQQFILKQPVIKSDYISLFSYGNIERSNKILFEYQDFHKL